MPADPLAILLPMAVAIGVPAVYLYAVRRLDLHASGGFNIVVICFVCGLAAFPLSFLVNTGIFRWQVAAGAVAAVALLTIKTLVAPIVEEILKSTGVVYAARRSDFTYFVDGAIYGFAAGTAFAILENVYYLASASAPLALSVNRAFSTSLMHGSASALVGVAVGRARFSRGGTRGAALLVGWSAAIAMHMTFNRLVNTDPLTQAVLIAAVLLGFAGLAMTAGFILWGLRAERAWMRETLNLEAGVSAGEANVVQRLADLGSLLAPVEAHFGREKRGQVEDFLRIQARYGIKRKGATLAADPRLRAELEAQAAALQAEMDDLRRAVGVYCMAYVRTILPPETEPIWDQLNLALAAAPEPTMNMWQILADKQPPAAPPAPVSRAAGTTAGDTPATGTTAGDTPAAGTTAPRPTGGGG